MHSIRTKLTFVTVCVSIIVIVCMALISVFFIRSYEKKHSDQLLLLLCETGEKNLDYYFDGVQDSVRKVSEFAERDLDGLDEKRLEAHVERVRETFSEMAYKTNGVLTYYYRIDPKVSDTVRGFWYTDLNGEGFSEHLVTDITLYDTEDTSNLVWFTVPKNKGEPVWLAPYVTENLEVRVISYNVPIYLRGQFVGVVGIEMDYSTMAEQVESIRLYNNGYAFLCDEEGNVFYHPRIDVSQYTGEDRLKLPGAAVDQDTFIRYTFENVEKIAVWLPLSNGMRLNVCAPVSEMEGDWQRLLWDILIVAGTLLITSGIFLILYTRHTTKPLEQLAQAAVQVDQGNYDIELNYNKNDEVGRLTGTLKRLSGQMNDYIFDLSKKVFVDSLTSVRNKGAYANYIAQLQEQMLSQREDETGEPAKFAIGVFGCDDLKIINEKYGHEKGDIYLMNASRLICRMFQHSPVFRTGGDEFTVILQNEDLQHKDDLVRQFREKMAEISAAAENEWEQVHITMGIALYDPSGDRSVSDVMSRADKALYENKQIRKK